MAGQKRERVEAVAPRAEFWGCAFLTKVPIYPSPPSGVYCGSLIGLKSWGGGLLEGESHPAKTTAYVCLRC